MSNVLPHEIQIVYGYWRDIYHRRSQQFQTIQLSAEFIEIPWFSILCKEFFLVKSTYIRYRQRKYKFRQWSVEIVPTLKCCVLVQSWRHCIVSHSKAVIWKKCNSMEAPRAQKSTLKNFKKIAPLFEKKHIQDMHVQ